MSYDLVVRGGLVVTSEQAVVADVAVAGERIAAIGSNLAGGVELDASGRYVIPGAVDGHVHLTDPTFPPYALLTADSFATGTRAAAFGGVTTVVDFAQPAVGQPLVEGLEQRLADAAGEAVIDYGLHLNLRDPDPARLSELPAVFERGVPSVKLYMAYEGYRLPDLAIFRAMAVVGAHGGLAVLHAENDDVIGELGRRLEAEERPALPGSRPAAHPRRRPRRCTARLPWPASSERDCSSSTSRARSRRARSRAPSGTDGTSPAKSPRTGSCSSSRRFARAICAHSRLPSGRRSATRRSATRSGPPSWRAPSTSSRPTIARACRSRRRTRRASPASSRASRWCTPSASARDAHLRRWVEVCCTRPAELFGLTRKGRLRPGCDADIVLFDPHKRVTLSSETLHSPLPVSSYDGVTLTGFPVTTISRGEVIVADGVLIGEAGRGSFVERGN